MIFFDQHRDRWKYLCFFTALILSPLLLGASGSAHGTGCQSSAVAPVSSPKAPDFSLELSGNPNKRITLSEVNSQNPVLLAFWATWCPSCVSEIPTLNKWKEKYRQQGLRILGINVQESHGEVDEFKSKFRMDYMNLLDINGDVASQYNVEGLPVTVLLAKGGEIIYYGYELPQNIDRLLTRSH